MTHEERLRYLWTKLANEDQLQVSPPTPRPKAPRPAQPVHTTFTNRDLMAERQKHVLAYIAGLPLSRQRPMHGPTVHEISEITLYGIRYLREQALNPLAADGLLRGETQPGPYPTRWYITDAGLDRLAEMEREGAA
jgi:hypothetical protein